MVPRIGQKVWWTVTGSNRRHLACKASALPAELTVPGTTGKKNSVGDERAPVGSVPCDDSCELVTAPNFADVRVVW